MSSKVKPASATAASHASMVSDSGGTISRRPSRDTPMPVIAELVLELLGGEHRPDMLAEVRGARSRRRAAGAGVLSAAGREHRQPDVFDVARRSTSTVCPSFSSSGSQSTMLVVNRTRGSSTMATWATTYGGGRSGKPNRWLTVKRGQRGLAGHVAHTHVAAAAVPAHRLRRMDQRLQSRTPGSAGRRRRPRSRRTRSARELGKRSCHRTNPEIASLSSVFGSGSGDSCGS